jgi:hypothetical protein
MIFHPGLLVMAWTAGTVPAWKTDGGAKPRILPTKETMAAFRFQENSALVGPPQTLYLTHVAFGWRTSGYVGSSATAF